MIELTPLDVRKKKGDFRRGIRGYESAQVDDFLDIVADRMEALVREAAALAERVARLEQQVADYRDREKALTEALVTAQQMREDIRTQSTREVEMIRKHAEQQATAIKADALKAREREEQALRALRTRQAEFLNNYRALLESELGQLNVTARTLDEHEAVADTPAKQESAPPVGDPSPPPAREPGTRAHFPAAKPGVPPARGSGSKGSLILEDEESFDDAPWATPTAPDKPPARAEHKRPAASPSGRATEPRKSEPSPKSGKGKSVDDELDAQLADALARWEPELEADKSAPAQVARRDDLDEDEPEEIELLLDDDDIVTPGPAPKKSTAPNPRVIEEIPEEEDIDAELAELLGPDAFPPRSAKKPAPAVAPPAPPQVAKSAPQSWALPAAQPAPALAAKPTPPPPPPPRDLSGEVDAAMGEESGTALIDLEDSLGAPQPAPFRPPAPPVLEKAEEGFEQPVAEAAPEDDATLPSPSNMVDLESYNNFQNYPALDADTSGLTLHPMFFDQDSNELPGLLNPADEKRKEERGQRWTGGDKG